MAELTTLARPYAKGAFKYALDADELSGWGIQLALLAAVIGNDKLARLISSPALTTTEQAKVLTDVCGDELSQPVKHFVELLAENKRLRLLPEIGQLFDALKTQHEQAVDVELITAMELDNTVEEKLARALADKLARKVNVKTLVDDRLMAGVIIKAGDMVIDGSMRGRLEKLAKAMNT